VISVETVRGRILFRLGILFISRWKEELLTAERKNNTKPIMNFRAGKS